MSSLPLSRTDDAIAFISERVQSKADEHAEVEWEREQRIEREVTFSDLLDELCELSDTQRKQFMTLVARGSEYDLHWIHCTLAESKEKIVKRRMAQGE